jgi:hypothetical protein
MKKELYDFIDKVVCKYCQLPYNDEKPSHLIAASASFEEEQWNIKRIRITFDLTISHQDHLSFVMDDINKQLQFLKNHIYKNNKIDIFSDDSKPMWNKPIISGKVPDYLTNYLEEELKTNME